MHTNGFHTARLCKQQQKVERVSVQPETNPSLGALASFPDFSVTLILSATSLFFSCHSLLLVVQPPPQSCFMYVFLLLSLFQTCGSMTWWSWCWRSPYPKSPTVSATCCCARSGFYSACSTVTSSCERSARLMSTGESFSSFFIPPLQDDKTQ